MPNFWAKYAIFRDISLDKQLILVHMLLSDLYLTILHVLTIFGTFMVGHWWYFTQNFAIIRSPNPKNKDWLWARGSQALKLLFWA